MARLNYLAPGRPDLAYAVKELARSMSTPTNGDWLRLKRLSRYLKGRPPSGAAALSPFLVFA